MAVVDLVGRVMGSELQIIGVDSEPGLLHAARAHLERLERCWTRFSPDSDIGRINGRSFGNERSAIAIAPETAILIARMIDGWRITAGAFNPTILRRLVENGYSASHTDPTRVTHLPSWARSAMGMESVRLDADAGTVSLPAGLVLDPGGIGKGLAADLTAEWMVREGAGGAMVSIGGDLSMRGRASDEDGWIVAVERPDPRDGILCALAVSGGGVATSSSVSRTWSHHGTSLHHVVDPTTGACATTDLAAATVFAATAWQAEVLATAALLKGAAGVVDDLERQGLDGIAVTHSGDVLCTYDLRDMVPRAVAGVR